MANAIVTKQDLIEGLNALSSKIDALDTTLDDVAKRVDELIAKGNSNQEITQEDLFLLKSAISSNTAHLSLVVDEAKGLTGKVEQNPTVPAEPLPDAPVEVPSEPVEDEPFGDSSESDDKPSEEESIA